MLLEASDRCPVTGKGQNNMIMKHDNKKQNQQ